ncbi:hypothetical protein [Cohnella sp. JJ-181]|uniref:hypothetical protein n=1 Tax=Cohnella rhizoplanae TaxID=2974897 RepID=UPI0022FF9EBC|nr:hypothetical protein [Cohnella sp. JJ-181]CAI6080000.1 hypothetical protein COHCIP112018_02869 [Cohnella sp. JJ-181]
MRALHCSICATDDDFAQASLFLLEHMRDVHPSFSVMDTVTLVYQYITEGTIVLVKEGGEAVGLGAYYHGTRDEAYENKDIALIDLALAARSHRGTRVFLDGLGFTVRSIAERHPEVREVRLAAQTANEYLNRLYAKFAAPTGVREGAWGEETLYSAEVTEITAVLGKWNRV